VHNQNRIFRLFQLINFLKARPAKSVRSVELFLKTSSRTVYRYIDLLQDLGFNVEKDGNSRLFIGAAEEAEELPFTPQEAQFIKKLILSTGKDNKLAHSILQKIQRTNDLELGAESLFKAHLSKIVEQISLAIVEKKQLRIKGYHSANSESITDRLVEPICFTDNYESVAVFEIKTKQNKYFNVERMTGALLLDKPMKHEKLHQFIKPDIFGFQGKNLEKEIEFEMSMRVCLLLKEDYPMSSAFITSSGKKKYKLKAKVQSFKAPGRFVLGFHDEINVLGSVQFSKYVKMMDAKK